MLAEELRGLGSSHIDSSELAERLRQKQEHISELKKKQSELARLTSVASKNEPASKSPSREPKPKQGQPNDIIAQACTTPYLLSGATIIATTCRHPHFCSVQQPKRSRQWRKHPTATPNPTRMDPLRRWQWLPIPTLKTEHRVPVPALQASTPQLVPPRTRQMMVLPLAMGNR